MNKQNGYYFGTEKNEKWYARYKGNRMFARGNGKYWFTCEGLYFHRYLTSEPFLIPYSLMEEIKVGSWHSGRWGQGNKVIKIIWKNQGEKLSSGFILSKNKSEVIHIMKELREKIQKTN